ncbi:phosphoribosylglycinamide formyltransferase [Motiliproteus sp. SC1-56]|uniref:phosphoribosylglycinamide formyltransferase n=1 Tax=Motiliproteus sp. SC1-56 TaxID=2799565 RepID=UPI001A8E91CE|nr:phosphoribosylglycinamide formyltransferase [Motiliproteus sp. SC1-56]
MSDLPNIVVLISGSGTNLQAIIDAVRSGDIPARISLVLSNRPEVKGLERARQAGIETKVLDHTEFTSREAFDAEMIRQIDRQQPDLVVLAGFMRILTGDFVRRYEGRMINIHPSLLPKYRGLHTHQRALDAGEPEHGVTVHFVTEELDGGPNIIQAVVPVQPDDTAETLAQRVQVHEHLIYPLAVKWFTEGRIRLTQGEVTLDGTPLPPGGCLLDSRD